MEPHTTSDERYTMIRVLRRTQQNIRIAAALAHTSGVQWLDQIVERELARMEEERRKQR